MEESEEYNTSMKELEYKNILENQYSSKIKFAHTIDTGRCCIEYIDGACYRGQTMHMNFNHVFQGYGILTLPNGNKKIGVWNNGKMSTGIIDAKIAKGKYCYQSIIIDYTPFRIENAEVVTLPLLICAHDMGVFNEIRYKTIHLRYNLYAQNIEVSRYDMRRIQTIVNNAKLAAN
jgi:hypothetical protein